MLTPLNSYLEITSGISDHKENLEASGQYRVLLFKLIGCTSHIEGFQGEGGGGGVQGDGFYG